MNLRLIVCLLILAISLGTIGSYADPSAKLSKLLENQTQLKRSLEKIENRDLLLIPMNVDENWIAIPFPKKDLESLINIWMVSEDDSIQQAVANAQAIIDFTLNYEGELKDQLAEINRQIEMALLEEKEAQALQEPKPGPQSKSKAFVTMGIENARSSARPGQKKWDFDWVFTEHSGVGVTLTSYELYLSTHTPGSEKVIKDQTNIRIDGAHVFRGPGFMTVETTGLDKDEKDLHAQMHAIYRGKDDNGHDVIVENYFFR
jgi:hypothetical protein